MFSSTVLFINLKVRNVMPGLQHEAQTSSYQDWTIKWLPFSFKLTVLNPVSQVDPLLLLKAALILQACQRCPLVLAGCVLFRGRWAEICPPVSGFVCVNNCCWSLRLFLHRVVSTQMLPELTVKVMVHETYTKVGHGLAYLKLGIRKLPAQKGQAQRCFRVKRANQSQNSVFCPVQHAKIL